MDTIFDHSKLFCSFNFFRRHSESQISKQNSKESLSNLSATGSDSNAINGTKDRVSPIDFLDSLLNIMRNIGGPILSSKS